MESPFLCITMLIVVVSTVLQVVKGAIGVNYGTVADDLPPPREVAQFLLESTVVNRIRLFDVNPEILNAFGHTNITLSVTIPNDLIPQLTKSSFAQNWLKNNIQPYIPATNIARILVGNEVLSTADKRLIASLVPAMKTLHSALVEIGLGEIIKVTTPHSMGILSTSSPPSIGKFRQGYDVHILKPLLEFLTRTGSHFLINPYPFFGSSPQTLDYALFRTNPGVVDGNTGLTYTNMLDAQLDAVFSAIKNLGCSDVEIVVAETGWPSRGDQAQFGVDPDTAAEYNRNLVRHVTSGIGTPLMPNRTFETYIFALFNEDLKPGPICERNFGLFKPDLTPVYDIGILRSSARSSVPASPVQGPSSNPMGPMTSPLPPRDSEGKLWCLPKRGADSEALQRNIDYVCGLGLDCGPIQEDGPCFEPNTARAHAAFAMNLYYQVMGTNGYDCDFDQTGVITHIDPSYGRCKY